MQKGDHLAIGFFHGKGTRVTNRRLYVADIKDTLSKHVLLPDDAPVPHFQLVPNQLFGTQESVSILEVRCQPKDARYLRTLLSKYPQHATFAGQFTTYTAIKKDPDLYQKIISAQQHYL